MTELITIEVSLDNVHFALTLGGDMFVVFTDQPYTLCIKNVKEFSAGLNAALCDIGIQQHQAIEQATRERLRHITAMERYKRVERILTAL